MIIPENINYNYIIFRKQMKRKFLLTAVALLCSVGSWAQSWTAGAVAADEGEYYLYNIGAQRFLNRGGTYTTHAIADGQGVVVKLDEKPTTNVFSIYTGVNSKYLNGDYTDGGELNWTFESVSVAGYTNVYTLKDGTESKYLYWTGGGAGFWGNEVLRSATITEGQENNFYWILIPKATRQNLASASSASPLDITYLVINPDFEYQIQDDPWKNDDTMKPWTGDWGKKTQGWTNTNFWRQQSSQTFANGIFFEKYSAEGLSDADKIYQNVTLEAGKYQLTCSGISRDHDQFYLYAGDQETKITDAGTYTVDFEVTTSGSVEIGAKIKEGSTGDWVAFDNVRLYCVDPYISVIATDFSSGSEMAAGQWYKFTAADGDKRISASTPADIVITADDHVVSTGGTVLTSYTGKLVSGTEYYIKSSSAQTVTIETSVPSLAEGTYYFKVAKAHNGTNEVDAVPAGKYLSRGRASGTHATVDTYGLPIEVAVLANGYYTLSPADTKRFYYHASNWDCWADKTPIDDKSMFELTLSDGKYKIRNAAMPSGTYLKYNDTGASDATVPVYDDGTGTNHGPYILWTAESLSDHATAMAALKNSQAATAAAAAYDSGNYSSLNGITTVSGLKTALESYVQGDFVSASDIETVQEKYQGSQPGSSNIVETVYSNTIDITQAGLYKFSMQAFYRAASNATTQALHTAGADFPPVVLYFGSAETQIKSVYDESSATALTEASDWTNISWNDAYYPNDVNTAKTAFQADMYHNDVWLYVSEPGTYSYGVKYMGWANANMQWFIYSPESVTITSYAEAATSADYTALSAAITAYDAATWGFDEDEYAPYNNINAINNIAAARAINSEETNSKLLVNSLTSYLALTVNEEDVDAIYNGNFATVADGANYPKGWTRTNGWGQMRTDADASSTSNQTAYYNQPGSLQYGNQGSYTMPLNANTIYTLTFKYASFDTANPNAGMTVSVLNGSSEGGQEVNFGANSTLYNTSDAFVTKTLSFATKTAGDYVLTLANAGNTVMTDVSITKAASQTLTLPSATQYAAGTYPTVALSRTFANTSNWYTLCAPFDFPKSAFAEVKVLDSVTDKDGDVNMTFTDASETIAAGTPCLVKPSSADATLSVENVAIDPATSAGSTDKSSGTTTVTYVGKFENTVINGSSVNNAWVVSDNALYHVAEGHNATVGAYRAYFTVATGGTVKALSYDFGDAVGIEAIDNGQLTIDNDKVIYNLAGQRMNKLQRGVNIVNGKKVLVK